MESKTFCARFVGSASRVGGQRVWGWGLKVVGITV